MIFMTLLKNLCILFDRTRSLLIPFWVDQFCYHHASVTTSLYVDGCASVKLLLYAMGAEMLSAVSNFCDGQ